ANGVVTVSAASYAPHRAAGEAIVSAFGSGLAERPETATTIPLPTWLAGVTVKVKDSAGAERPAPLFYVSPGQINFQIPAETKSGAAIVSVVKDGALVSSGTVQVVAVAPGL